MNDVPILGFLFASALLFLAVVADRTRDGWARAGLVVLGLSVVGGPPSAGTRRCT